MNGRNDFLTNGQGQTASFGGANTAQSLSDFNRIPNPDGTEGRPISPPQR